MNSEEAPDTWEDLIAGDLPIIIAPEPSTRTDQVKETTSKKKRQRKQQAFVKRQMAAQQMEEFRKNPILREDTFLEDAIDLYSQAFPRSARQLQRIPYFSQRTFTVLAGTRLSDTYLINRSHNTGRDALF